MLSGLLAILLAALPAPASAAQVAAVQLSGSALHGISAPAVSVQPLSPGLSSALMRPSLGQAALPGTGIPLPTLSLPSTVSPAPALPALPSAILATPRAVPVRGVAANLREFLRTQPSARTNGVTGPALWQGYSGFFDGKAAASKAPAPVPAALSGADAWTDGAFASPADGAEITYRSRAPAGEASAAPKLFVGGMAFPGSFGSYFETGRDRASREYALTLRGLPPTAWTRTKEVYDADAKDLARMIVLAARESGSRRVDLVLHSYSSLVFQRMLQLRHDPEVSRALRLLRAARVTFIGATTHYGDSETAAGPEYAEMARKTRLFISWLDAMDDYADLVRRTAELYPVFAPQAWAWLAFWKAQREMALSLASKAAVDLLMEHLKEPWEPAIDHVRQRMLKEARRFTRSPGWQEGMLRRADATSKLEFTAGDVARLRDLGVRLEILFSHRDQLIPWVSEKLMLDLLGIPAPEKVPPPGTDMRSPDGKFRARIVDGDHYFPLKRPGALRDLLE